MYNLHPIPRETAHQGTDFVDRLNDKGLKVNASLDGWLYHRNNRFCIFVMVMSI